jgi:hypothetical protein
MQSTPDAKIAKNESKNAGKNRYKFLPMVPLAKLPLRNDQLQKQSPQGLKPMLFQSTYGTTKVVP